MHELVTVVNGTTLTDTLIIAEGAETTHKTVLQLLRNYLPDFEEVGEQRVAFEMRPFETSGGIQNREIALLNEPQATLLFTFMKNTEIVRAFKVKLVKAFYAMRALPAAINNNFREQYDLLQVRYKDLLEDHVDLLKKQLKTAENKPHRRINFTPEEDVKMMELQKQGLSQREIGLELGRTKSSICSRLRKFRRAN